VTGAYLWNTGSWDVQGFYTGAEAYGDPVLVQEIRAHNP